MTPPTFDDDFAKGEAEAARLAQRYREALKRAEAFETQSKQEARLRKRAGARSGEPIGGDAEAERRAQRRLRDEEGMNRALRERRALQSRELQVLGAQEQAMKRLRRFGPYAYTRNRLGVSGTQPLALPPAGGTGGPYYGPGGPPTDRYYRPALPPGPPPPRQLGPGAPPPLALPAPGQTVGGTQYYGTLREEIRRAAKEYDAATGATGRQRAAQGNLNRTLYESLRIQGQANNQYARFGALSAEWIGAASRGATTIQELGRQTTVTIGKFGGWLAAGAALYAVLGAVSALGAGALDSASGVNQLDRVLNNVDSDSAQRAFRAKAEHFNLPISDVAGAAYEMGKVFHEQNEALEASDAVLYSVKVGELEYAEAARYLTAITRGFNLEAKDTPRIFDQINQAQNRLGVSIRDTEAGLAKAAGTISAAGNSGKEGFTQLLALMSLAQKATGQTGDVIGTAFARAPKFLRREGTKDSLRSYGIDPEQPILDIIEEAIRVADKVGGEKRQRIGEAIFGPFYGARVGTPLLNRGPKEAAKFLEEVSPEKAAGSAERELQKLLNSARELIAKIGTELKVLGSNLSSGGFLDAFGAGLKLLGGMLQLTNNLLEVFNKLPAPIRKSLAYFAEMYAILALLRRFNLGQSFAEGSLGQRVFTSPKAAQRSYREDLIGQQQALVGERERQTVQASRAAIGLNVAQAQKVAAEQEYARLVGIHGASSSQALAQKNVVARAQLAVNAAEERKLAAELAEMEILGAQKVVEDKKAALASARNEAEARALAARYGDTITGTFNRPLSADEAARERGYRIDSDAAGNFTFVPIGSAGAAQAEQMAKATPAIANRVRHMGAAWAALGRSEVSLRDPLGSAQRAASATTRAMRVTALQTSAIASGALPRAGAAIARGAGAMRGLASAGYAFIGGPIGALLLGVTLAAEFGDDLGRALAGGQDVIDRVEKEIDEKAEGRKEFFEQLDSGFFSDTIERQARDLLKHRAAAKARGESVRSIPETLRRAGLITNQEQKEAAEQEGPDYEETIEHLQVKSKLRQARAGEDKVKAAREALRTARQTLRILRKEGAGGKKQTEALTEVVEAKNALNEAVKQEAEELIDAQTNLAVARAGDDPVKQARAELKGARQKADLATTKAERKNAAAEVINAQRGLDDAVKERSKELQEANATLAEARAGDDPVAQARARLRSALIGLRFADTTAERRTAFAAVISARREVDEAVEDQAAELADATANLARARAGGDPVLEAKAQLEQARGNLSRADNEVERRNALAELLDAQKQLDESYAAIALSRIRLRASRTEDPVRQAALKVREARLNVRNADGKSARFDAEAEREEALRAKRDAVAQKRIENVEYDAALDRITNDQQIARYEHILRTAELGREARRSLIQRIHDLRKESEDEGNFELAVGDIKLPTIYDIRRAVAGGPQQGPTVVYNDNSTNSVNANVNGGNPDEVVGLMHSTFNRQNRNARRSAGMIP